MWVRLGNKENIKLFLLYYIFLAILSFSVFSCKEKSSSIQIDFLKTEMSAQDIFEQKQDRTIRFVIVSGNSPPHIMNLYGELFEYTGKKLGAPIQLMQRKTYAEINELLRTGDIDFAIIGPSSYVRAKEEFGVESVAVPVINGKALGHSYVMVRKDSGINKFQELKGRAYAFTHPSSTSGRLVPVYKLALLGETPHSFFNRYIFTYSHDKSIKAVEEGLVDGASIDSRVYNYLAINNPQRISYLKIIDRSPPYGISPMVVSPHSSPLLKNQVSKILLNLHTEQEGQRILKGLYFDRFEQPDEKSYNPIHEMRDFVMKKKRIKYK